MDLELACKFSLFSYFHWFQKYKDELWEPLGSASSGVAIFIQKYGKNTKEMAIIWEYIWLFYAIHVFQFCFLWWITHVIFFAEAPFYNIILAILWPYFEHNPADSITADHARLGRLTFTKNDISSLMRESTLEEIYNLVDQT